MSKFLWALVALTLTACDGGGPSGDGHGKDTTDTGTPANTGSLMVHATYGGGTEVCTVNSPDGELGQTEEVIPGLDPGELDIVLGDVGMTTLDGVPFHVTGGGNFLTGGGHATIEKDLIAQLEVNLEKYPQYHCATYTCDYPYEGGSCSAPNDSDDQWIYVGNDGVLHGSDTDTFDNIGGIVITLDNENLIVTDTIDGIAVLESHFDSSSLAFDYTATSDVLQFTAMVECKLKR